jgi:hypothetical protein
MKLIWYVLFGILLGVLALVEYAMSFLTEADEIGPRLLQGLAILLAILTLMLAIGPRAMRGLRAVPKEDNVVSLSGSMSIDSKIREIMQSRQETDPAALGVQGAGIVDLPLPPLSENDYSLEAFAMTVNHSRAKRFEELRQKRLRRAAGVQDDPEVDAPVEPVGLSDAKLVSHRPDYGPEYAEEADPVDAWEEVDDDQQPA